jgi:hypothetical protein
MKVDEEWFLRFYLRPAFYQPDCYQKSAQGFADWHFK